MDTGLLGKRKPDGSAVTKYMVEWPLYFCNANAVWNRVPPRTGGASMGQGVTVVHPDTGYTLHPEVTKGGRVDEPRARNYLSEGQPLYDPLTGPFPSHGTATAGTLMSGVGHANVPPDPDFSFYTVPQHLFVSGVAPMGRIIPCRVTDSVMLVGDSVRALTRAIHYATDLSVSDLTIGVMSISLGRLVNRTILQGALAAAIRAARMNGIVICAAAGQLPMPDGTPGWVTPSKILTPRYPGHDENVICVAACDSEHNMLDVGFYGPAVNITAPGVDIFRALSVRNEGAIPTFDYRVEPSTGTSYATPIVAGACALWQAHHGREWLIVNYGSALIFDLFLWTLSETCDTRGGTWDTEKYGMGVLNVEALLQKEPISKAGLLVWIDSTRNDLHRRKTEISTG